MASDLTSNPASPPKQVQVAIAVVFDHQDNLLICKRKADTVLGGYWEFPGGKCNPGESPAACAIREVEEETGLHVAALQPLPIIEHVYPHAHIRLHPFICRWQSGLLELREVAEARWIAPPQVADYRFPEANTGLINAIRAGDVRPPQ